MKRIKAVFNLQNAWEEWVLEVPDDWTPEDGIVTDNIECIADAGNDAMEFTGEFEELD